MTREKPHVRILRRLGACSNAIAWAAGYPSGLAAWRACERGDWMLWWAARCVRRHGDVIHRRVVLAAAACAATATRYCTPSGSSVARRAIALARKWARGGLELFDELAAEEHQ